MMGVNFTVGAFFEDRDIEAQNAVTLGSNIAGLPVSVFGLFPIAIGQQFTPTGKYRLVGLRSD